VSYAEGRTPTSGRPASNPTKRNETRRNEDALPPSHMAAYMPSPLRAGQYGTRQCALLCGRFSCHLDGRSLGGVGCRYGLPRVSAEGSDGRSMSHRALRRLQPQAWSGSVLIERNSQSSIASSLTIYQPTNQPTYLPTYLPT
jgi:hypothetical protein